MTKFKDYQIDFFNKAQERFGRSIISKTEALELASEMGRKTATWFVNPKFRVARNQFQIPAFDGPQMVAQVVPIKPEVSLEQPMIVKPVPVVDTTPVYVPSKDPNYVKFGFY